MSVKQKPNKDVLIVEDEPDFASLIDSILKGEGFDTRVSFNGEDALEQMHYRPADLVTLDIGMPRKSGLFFYRKMKSLPALRRTPVIVITGMTRGDRDMENMIRSFLEVERYPPPEAYVEKPFSKGQLLEVVRAALRTA